MPLGIYCHTLPCPFCDVAYWLRSEVPVMSRARLLIPQQATFERKRPGPQRSVEWPLATLG
jgi:hypothetical protein